MFIVWIIVVVLIFIMFIIFSVYMKKFALRKTKQNITKMFEFGMDVQKELKEKYSDQTEEQVESKCSYCGTRYNSDTNKCPNCGAKNTK